MGSTDPQSRSLAPITPEVRDVLPSLSIEAPSPSSANYSPSPNRISASFFSTIDPFLPRRQGTYNLTPQYVFPSALNNLPPWLSAPYAFNHNSLSFYWTRDDALIDAAWNIWGRPPCLNCVVACGGKQDGDLARWCDFGERRDGTFGRVAACARCLRMGEEGACVEQIEVRKDGSVSAREEDLQREGTGRVMWSSMERTLRQQGIVEWRAINLHVGDVDGKRKVVEAWDHQQEDSSLAGFRENWVLPTKPTLFPAPVGNQVRKSRDELVPNREGVEVEKARHEKARARVREWDHEDILLGRREVCATQGETADDVFGSIQGKGTRREAWRSEEPGELRELYDLKDMVNSMLRERMAQGVMVDDETF